MTASQPKTRLRPVIRVFVSSTFSDLKHERNALQAQVFPKLEQLCLKNGFQFQAIDLRWGVSSEAGLDHRTMRICFDELRRAQEISPRPNFLILLGNRYGWRPLPEEISADEYQALERAAAQVATITDQPAAAVLQGWYRRDENAVPPVYLLQSRRQQLPDAKDYTQDALWNEVQAILWAIINRAQPPAQLWGRFDETLRTDGSPPPIVRFQASATEQEIWHGALRVPDAREHVLAFFRHIENVSEFSEPAQIKDFVDLKPSGSIDAALPAEQERLNAELRKRLGGANVFETRSARLVPALDSQGRPTADVTTDHLAQLCSDVESRLTQIIQGQIEEYWNKTAQASTERAARELKIEQDEHERFGRERGGADSFVGRQTELRAILGYVRSDSPWPLVVHGASGCGKTALLARAVGELDHQPSTINYQPICRFIGVTPHSSDVRSLLGSLCQELRLRYPREGDLPADTKALREELHEQFRSATPEQPLILFLDALDQLSDADGGRLLNWIPTGALPGHVKLVVSCLSDRAEGDPAGQPCAELRRRQLPAKNLIDLDALSEDEASTLLFERWLPQAGRTVSPDQREHIEQRLASLVCRQPIYLKLLFEEARLWHSYDAVPGLGEDVSALLGQLFDRLSLPANHGRLLVERVLGYLAASRHGLAENEILEILFTDPEYKAALDQATEQTRHELPASATRMPVAIWSRLRYDLAPYLTERAAPGANVLTFYHRQVAAWTQEHLLTASGRRWSPHRRLGEYFNAQDFFTESRAEQQARAKRLPPTPREINVRKVDELPWQTLEAAYLSGEWKELESLFTNFLFVEAKVEAGLVFDLVADFGSSLNALPEDRPMRRVMRLLEEALRRDIHFIARHPTTAFQCLLNSCWWYDCPDAANHHEKPNLVSDGELPVKLHGLMEHWRTRRKENATTPTTWLRSLRPPVVRLGAGMNLVLSGHESSVTAVAVSRDERLIASASFDNSVRIWDVLSGVEVTTLLGHEDYVLKVVFSPDSRKVASASYDGTVRVWDVQRGCVLTVLSGHGDMILELDWSADGRRIASMSRRYPPPLSPDWTTEIWDSATGQRLLVLAGPASSLSFSPDGSLMAGIREESICIWDVETGYERSILTDCEKIEQLAFLPDGERLVGIVNAHSQLGNRKMIRLWSMNSGQQLMEMQGPQDPILKGDLSISSDGRFIACADGHVACVWDIRTGRECFKTPKDKADVENVTLFPRSHRIAVACQETIRVWDFGKSSTSFPRPDDEVHALDIAPNGNWITSHGSTLFIWDSQYQHLLKRIPNIGPGERKDWWISRSGRWVIADLADGSTRPVYDLQENRQAQLARTVRNFSPTDALVAGLCETGAGLIIRISDACTGRLRLELGGKEWHVSSELRGISFSPDGRSIFAIMETANRSRRLCRWDVRSGAEELALDGDWTSNIVLTPDGQRLVCGLGDEAVVISAADGRMLGRLVGHESTVTFIAISPDGRRVASWARYARNRAVRVWDVFDYHQVTMIPIPNKRYGFEVKFSSSGKQLYEDDPSPGIAWDSLTGAVVNTVEGVCDMEAICGGDEKYPVHLISPGWRGETLGESIETIVISTTNNTIHGWFNDSFSSIRTHPLGHIWVGISGAFYIVVSWENE